MKRLLTGALALTLLTGTAAMAQPGQHGNHGAAMGQSDHRDNQGAYGQQNREDRGGYDNRGNDRSREVHKRNDERRAEHRWARGQRMPSTWYRDRGHYVDYRSHQLRAPPRGYRWVETDDNRYAMVGTRSGLIAAIVAATR